MNIKDIEVNKIKLMLCIAPTVEEHDLIEVLTRNGARGCVEFSAKGMASSEILNLLGLSDDVRALVLCCVREEDVPAVKDALMREIFTGHGHGIALVLRVDGFMGAKSLFRFSGDLEDEE